MNYLENYFDMFHLIISKFDWNVNIVTYSGNIRRPLFMYIVKHVLELQRMKWYEAWFFKSLQNRMLKYSKRYKDSAHNTQCLPTIQLDFDTDFNLSTFYCLNNDKRIRHNYCTLVWTQMTDLILKSSTYSGQWFN